MRQSRLYAALAASAVPLVISACGETAVQVQTLGALPMDSATMLASAPVRPPGLFLVPVTSDSLVLAVATDSFTIELVDRA